MIQNYYFANLLQSLQTAGFSVYWTHLPPASTPYPFIFLDEPECTEEAIKAGRKGTLYQSVHLWHNKPQKRGDLVRMMEMVRQNAARISQAGSYGLMLVGSVSRMLYDDTTKEPLLHGVVELTYNYS